MDNENKVPEITTEKKLEEKTKAKENTKTNCCAEGCDCSSTPERKKMIILGVAIVLVLLILVGYKFKGANPLSFFQHAKVLNVEEAKAVALDFIGKNLVQPGTKVDIT